jgi:hypothetical protein
MLASISDPYPIMKRLRVPQKDMIPIMMLVTMPA